MAVTANSFSTSASLIRRVKARDPEAWQRLSQLYGPLVYRWTRQFGLQPNDAADVVQNVFFSVSRNVDRYSAEGPADSFRGWLWTITRNAVREFHRDKATRPHAVGGSDAHAQFQQISENLAKSDGIDSWNKSSDSTILAHRALKLIQGDFESRTWQAFWRTTLDGQSATDVAEELGLSPKAVRQAKYRVLCRLREILSEE